MSSLTNEELQILAMADWRKGNSLSTELWQRIAVVEELYKWAVEQQAAIFARSSAIPYVPSRESLLAPAAPVLVLAPSPAPSPTGAGGPPSTRRLNRGRRVAQAVVARKNQEQAVAFAPRDFVMFSLPLKSPKINFYERTNGKYRYRVETGGGLTVPFGQDRLFPLWVATAFKAAGQPDDNRIRFACATDILRAFQQPEDGYARNSLRLRIERWFHTTVYVYDDSIEDRRSFAAYRLIDGGQFWYQTGRSVNQHTLWQNYIDLNPKFADGLRQSTIPIDFETVVALRDEPAVLDLYIWQAHRSWELARKGANRPVAIPLALLLAQLGTSNRAVRKARQNLRDWQAIVKEVWRGCPNFFDPHQDLFFVHAGRAVFERTTAKLPGVLPEPPVPLRSLQEPLADQGEEVVTLSRANA